MKNKFLYNVVTALYLMLFGAFVGFLVATVKGILWPVKRYWRYTKSSLSVGLI